MPTKLTANEVALLIRARQLLKEKKLAPDADVKTICEYAGISRKTGYQWVKKHDKTAEEETHELCRELGELKAEHEKLKKTFDDIRFENEGRKIAWKIHEVDKMIATKKNTSRNGKNKMR